jgi:hypothetical protein
MLPGTPDTINTAVDDRAAAFTSARALLPADTNPDEVMRVAEWLLTGSTLLDPAKITAAARILYDITKAGQYAWGAQNADTQAMYEGRAARVVTAYLTAEDA